MEIKKPSSALEQVGAHWRAWLPPALPSFQQTHFKSATFGAQSAFSLSFDSLFQLAFMSNIYTTYLGLRELHASKPAEEWQSC